MNIQTIAKSLGGEKKTPEGYICRCPCHDDKSASLSLKETSKGILLNCFAGCDWEDIKKELLSRGLIEPPRKSKYEEARFFIYRDLVGNIICRKVKLPNKNQWFERFDGGNYINGLAGRTIPLYNIAAVTKSDLVYLCEGEKDADTLIHKGLCATTNHAGAKSWAPHLTEQLRGKTVIIIPDNDEPGRKRVDILARALHDHVKEIRVFIPENVPEKGDITDWVNAGGDPSTILARSVVVEKKAAKKKATRDDYYQLIETTLNNPRKCIFNDKLMYLDKHSGLWNPAINALEILKSEALFQNEARETQGLGKFAPAHFMPHLASLEASKLPEFLVDVPDWDGEDRISAMAYLVKLRESSGVSECSFSELLKEWCALMFQRLHDPMIQNRVLVLQGGQGIGKDTWISMLVDGLGQFSVPLSVIKEDRDTYLNLYHGLIMKISEFDKTAKAEVSTLKDIITAPSTNLRAPYEKDSKLRLNRCSFISSANITGLLRDSTGNRRYLIFEVDSIQYAYEGWSKDKIREWQMQCLAEMRHLADINYTASADSWREMRQYIERETPSEYAADITEEFIRSYRKDSFLSPDTVEVLPNDDRVNEILSNISKRYSLKFGIAKNMVQRRIGTMRRVGTKRFWVWRVPALEPELLPALNGAHDSANGVPLDPVAVQTLLPES